MPSGVSDFGVETWLSALFGVVTRPTGYYVALCTDEPGAAMDGSILAELEPAGGGYARQLYGTGSTNWGSDGGFLTNLNDFAYARATADWGLITHYALLDASSAGNLYAWGEFEDAPNIASGQQMTIPAGGIVLGLSALADSIAV